MAVITGGRALAVAALLCTMAAMAVAWETSNVHATYYRYKLKDNEWDLNSVNAYCAPWDANKPLWWRKQYGWAALCDDSWSSGHGYCGKCIKHSNLVVRIGDQPRDRRVGLGEGPGQVQRRWAGPGLRDGVQEDRHRRARQREGLPQSRLRVG
ncbi:unnamed protein product [Urochloa decumbens]|uniref:Barwin domain-containing protein n=1 Tax=Urochloa decumbens TaxID=240449 RepID=A0ABC9AX01_9POAL